MLAFYRSILRASQPALNILLETRRKRGKELADRLPEKRGMATRPRPHGKLVWIHAASVGEAQSALILVDHLLKNRDDLYVLLTTGTVTSAQMMEKRLPPDRAFHQFYPLDYPAWVERFLGHWRPDLVLWMESELWPLMLMEIKARGIPAILVNARLSERSYRRWRLLKAMIGDILSAFTLILAQTREDQERFESLGAAQVQVTDNLKYSAKKLPADEHDLHQILAHIQGRPVWLFASTHKGEEEMACRIHQRLKTMLPGLLTILVPRHPARRDEISDACRASGLEVLLRGDNKTPPTNTTDIYIADTLGELGLFYRAVNLACIGRSFSLDGGGGHNPIEAAQLNCAVLHGPRVQYQQQIFDEMYMEDAALEAKDESELAAMIQNFLTQPEKLAAFQHNALNFARKKERVIDRVMRALTPALEKLKEKNG